MPSLAAEEESMRNTPSCWKGSTPRTRRFIKFDYAVAVGKWHVTTANDESVHDQVAGAGPNRQGNAAASEVGKPLKKSAAAPATTRYCGPSHNGRGLLIASFASIVRAHPTEKCPIGVFPRSWIVATIAPVLCRDGPICSVDVPIERRIRGSRYRLQTNDVRVKPLRDISRKEQSSEVAQLATK